jgi:hypothetical protein
MDNEVIKENLKKEDTWLRGFYMLIFFFALNIAETIMIACILFQFVSTILTGNRNENIEDFTGRLVQYITGLFNYLGYHSEDKPFPFGEYPSDA